MRLTNVDLVVTDLRMETNQTGPTTMSAETKTQKAVRTQVAVNVRFEITAEEIYLLKVSREEVIKLGENLAFALLGFVQAGDPDWKDKPEERPLDS